MCGACRDGRCDDPPSPGEPLDIDCFRCRGTDPACPDCHGSGVISIKRCPQLCITPNVRGAIDAIDMLDEFHLPPAAGGSMEQPHSFVNGMKFWRHELHVWEDYKRKQGNG